MLMVLRQTWALMLGIMLVMVGNGMQGTMLGVRGAIEGFTTNQMSLVMSGYFLGFLGGSRLTPVLIRRVGHVRVFAALGSLIAAGLVLYSVMPNWMVWVGMRVVLGFCFSGVYVTAESWLNDASSNDTRGKALSLYMIMQSAGIIIAQGLVNVGDPAGYLLFIIPSVLVSLSFTPILLSVSPTPIFEQTRPMGILRLVRISPLGCAGTFLMGGVFSALFGMAAVWGGLQGLTVREISLFVAAIYLGGLVAQYPVGLLSDRMDRRRLILIVAAIGAVAMAVTAVVPLPFFLLLVSALIVGAVANPLYALLIAHTNDFLEAKDMPAASGGMMFMNGLGAVCGPLVTGWIMGHVGPKGFFLYIAVLLAVLAVYAAWRMMRRAGPALQGAYTPITPVAGPVAVEAAMEASAADSRPDPHRGGA